MEKFKVTFQPENRTVEVEKDRTILSAALSAGVYINSSCGGDGVCGRCKVIVRRGKVLSQPTGMLSREEKESGVHLACITNVIEDIEVEIPSESRTDFEALSTQEIQKRLGSFAAATEDIQVVEIGKKDYAPAPLVKKIFVRLSGPTDNDNISDLDRLSRDIAKKEGIPKIQTALVNVRSLGKLLRDADWDVTVTLARRGEVYEMLAIDPGDTAAKNFGIAFDIGTTTVSGQLIDLASGKVLGTKAVYNRQAAFGADVITRIIYAEKEEGLEQLHEAAVSCMNDIIHDLTREHTIDLNDVASVVCTGNTTMIHLLLRIDPSFIRRQPYVPTTNFVGALRCQEAGLQLAPRALVFCAPGISSYVGGDVTAGVLAIGQESLEELSLLIDIGTNGEVVLGNKEFLIATSASAGPAFEGSGVTSGMRSSQGAIQRVAIDTDLTVRCETIGGTRPRGICGSGYIDTIAELLRAGVLDKDGKIKPLGHARIRSGDAGREFVIAFKQDTQNGTDIVLTEADIENLKRAKAAIYAACNILIRHMSFTFDAVKKIYIAGGFGTSLNIANAIRIGLLPDLAQEKFVFVGNTSLAGARQMLVSGAAYDTGCEIARTMAYFELSTESSYMDEYMAALFFPHTDIARFPSVTA